MEKLIEDLRKSFKIRIDANKKMKDIIYISDVPFCVEQNFIDKLRKENRYERYVLEVKKIIEKESNNDW